MIVVLTAGSFATSECKRGRNLNLVFVGLDLVVYILLPEHVVGRVLLPVGREERNDGLAGSHVS